MSDPVKTAIALVLGAQLLGGNKAAKAAFIVAPYAVTAAAAAGAAQGRADYEAGHP